MMRSYVVFVNYGLEGWKIYDQADTLADAVRDREEAMGNGNREVVIFKPVRLIYQELESDTGGE